jgi:hypothetical protein
MYAMNIFAPYLPPDSAIRTRYSVGAIPTRTSSSEIDDPARMPQSFLADPALDPEYPPTLC